MASNCECQPRGTDTKRIAFLDDDCHRINRRLEVGRSDAKGSVEVIRLRVRQSAVHHCQVGRSRDEGRNPLVGTLERDIELNVGMQHLEGSCVVVDRRLHQGRAPDSNDSRYLWGHN